MADLMITYVDVRSLRPYQGNARTHSKKQIKQIAASMREFGFCNPVLVTDELEIVAGHGRVEAAKHLGMDRVPSVRLSHLSEAQRRAYVLADNQLATKAGWDHEILAIELQALVDLNFDLELTGFSAAEVDLVIGAEAEKASTSGPEDTLPPEPRAPVSRPGDVWCLGNHRVICGDAREAGVYEALMRGEQADLVFTDPLYNVKISGHVCGLGQVKHDEFAFASGEMSETEFTQFLSAFLDQTKAVCRDGAILFVCMDWRHMFELQSASRRTGLELKNLCIWAKDNGGMGSFYRSKHELVFVLKHGTAPHTNTFELGQHGRYRTNVWEYAGVNTLRPGRMDELAMHPTVKPVALVADALLDCSKRRQLVLDPFAGSGTTVIAAEKTGRRARAIEYEPKYVDLIVRRWEAYAGKLATLAATGALFEDVVEERRTMPAADQSVREEVAA